MKLGFNLDFNELDLTGLKKLDQIFLDYLFKADKSLHKDLMLFRATPLSIIPQDYSKFLLKISPHLDDFLAELFCISKEVTISRLKHKDFDIIYECKRKFVQRVAVKKYPLEKIKDIDFEDVYLKITNLIGTNFTSREFAKQIVIWQQDEESFSLELDIAARYAAYRVFSYYNSLSSWNKNLFLQNDILFNLQQKLDKKNLIDDKKILKYQKNERVDFDYKDSFFNLDEALNNSHYCIYCHKRDKDSCSKGFDVIPHFDRVISVDKIPRLSYRMTTGCPLKQKISEMNYIKAQVLI
ncbi:unknown [Rickettsia prowazekii str. Madrid E]|uniref:Uncharacterized protein RP005 n=1 Tax=Rickettsia prowazekii (strain Madrid E) TaxID=272947 RepID=Y005_RICPR|nr:RecName: Full=Uncharacterized protein RP005 [Rickettsia prowazekii str. Madrid E]CAA14478.1 unknown [Rickettsia prowazekii str. Madrid E]